MVVSKAAGCAHFARAKATSRFSRPKVTPKTKQTPRLGAANYVPCVTGKAAYPTAHAARSRKETMRRTAQIDLTSDQVEVLLDELRAIDHWDAKYETHRRPKWGDTVAYISRQRRRGEILRQLLPLARTEYERVRAQCSDFVTKHTRFPTRAFGGISFGHEEIVGNHNMEKRPYLAPKAVKVDIEQAEEILRDRTKCTDSEAKTILEPLLREQRQRKYQTEN